MSLQQQESNAIQQLLDLAKAKGIEAEIQTEFRGEISASYTTGEKDEVKSSENICLGVRVIEAGREGCAYSEDLNPGTLADTFDRARQMAKVVHQKFEPALFATPDSLPQIDLANPELDELDIDEIFAAAKCLDEAFEPFREKVTSYNSNVGKFSKRIRLANTKGLDQNYSVNGCMPGVYLTAEGNGIAKSAWETGFSRDRKRVVDPELSAQASQKVLDSLDSRSVKTGNRSVILAGEAMSRLLSSGFQRLFSAEDLYNETSVLCGKLGESIANSSVTIVDDPLISDAGGSRPFDSQGTASSVTTLVKEGVFQAPLTNAAYAKLLDVTNSGHAYKTPTGTMSIQQTNMVMQPGSKSFADLLGIEQEILVIDEVNTRIDPLTGDFSAAVSGALYKGGVRQHGVHDITLAANIVDLLQNVTAVGNDTYLRYTTDDWGQVQAIAPSVFLENVSIGGTA